jgi:hypothetical protein
MTRISRLLLAAIGALIPVTSLAQGIATNATPQLPAGPQNSFTATISAFDFASDTGQFTGGVIDNGEYMRACASAGCSLVGTLHLPSGVVLDSIELDACDEDPANDVSVTLFDCIDGSDGPGPCTPIDNFSTSGTPGCTYISGALLNTVVANFTHDYLLDVGLVGDGVTSGLRGVKVYYHLQVSAPPGTPTFNDVPTTDPAFQFIEAFTAAGITAGCASNPPLYCPDATVTRRQMAVFFAKALGLNFPD